MAFVIDLLDENDKNVKLEKLEILEFDKEDLAEDLKFFEKKNPEDLTDFNRIVFKDEQKAKLFLKMYTYIYNDIKKRTITQAQKIVGIPSMAYYKRHLVQTLMNFKLRTNRTYKKSWKPGQKFYLHDRTHFLLVTLEKIVAESDNTFTYYFK